MATRPVEDFVKDLFQSEEYRAALKARVLDGSAKKHEIELAQSLGLAVSEEDQARQYLAAMDDQTRRLLLDLCAVSQSKASTSLRVVQAGSWTGVVMPTTIDADRLRFNRNEDPAGPNTEPDASTENLDDGALMPPKTKSVP